MTDPDFRAALAAAGFTLDPATGEVAELAPYVGGVQCAGGADRPQHRPVRGRVAGRQPRPGARAGGCGSRGTGGPGRTPAPTRSSPPTAPRWSRGWNERAARPRATATPPARRYPSWSARHGSGGLDRDGAVETACCPGSGRGGRRGTPPTSAARSRSGSPPPAWWSTRRSGSSWPRTSPPASSRRVCRCWTGRTCRSTSAPSPRRRCSPSRPTSSPGSPTRRADAAGATMRPRAAGPEGWTTRSSRGRGPRRRRPAGGRRGGRRCRQDHHPGRRQDRCSRAQGRRMVVVTPTLKAAQVAAREVGTAGFSVAWLVHQHGFRWDDDGRWTRQPDRPPTRTRVLGRVTCCWSTRPGCSTRTPPAPSSPSPTRRGARVALVGDRHQLPAVGRGGVLDLAARWVTPEAMSTSTWCTGSPTRSTPRSAWRCARAKYDPRGEGVRRAVPPWPDPHLPQRGRAHPGAGAARRRQPSSPATAAGALVMADTREQVAGLNGAIRDRLVAAGHVDDTHGVVTKRRGTDRGRGPGRDPAQRPRPRRRRTAHTWTVTAIGDDGTLTVAAPTAATIRDRPGRLCA